MAASARKVYVVREGRKHAGQGEGMGVGDRNAETGV